jgi:hypothetical protein
MFDVAAAHGQAGWLAWADAVVLELMSIASGLELRRRKRSHQSVRFPAAVMSVSVVLSLGAQVVEAEPSVLGWIAAAIPALGFLIMVKIALAHSGSAADDFAEDATSQTETSASDGGESRRVAGEVERADPDVAMLIPAARAAAAALVAQRRRVTVASLGDVLRADGYGVSQARASALFAVLKPAVGGPVALTAVQEETGDDAADRRKVR